jgi:hypothetical protein
MFRRTMMRIALGVALATTGGATTFAQGKIPSTPEEHFTLAKKYQGQADAARRQAVEHREMAEAARQSAVNVHAKQGQKDPQVARMEKHCAALVQAADRLAQENQKAADFHVLRGKELQGK